MTCGDDNRPGCGKPVSPDEVCRCTDCGVAFHRLCAVEHFAANGLTTAVDVSVFDLMREERNAAQRRAKELEAHFASCADCHDCAIESGVKV